ncbi:Serine/threonine-protein kinase smg1 [Alternaria novae-zelandiae]|uniref:Serine/threonine-protein kinase smg1 n=1 Tax=Alternaria triticimaculans TaxID=297637 RepID=UPI0020C1D519|nr:Serine/threonine-protein kinase smg1 [Alternaria triticimaculans]XP_049251742.1 Serine/threonine-protein kinase smg1 [Alternaria novae-zelandiae]KAI4661605.1 Serine/threonine-protein kinase smg1 [Alternaria triticimaculans]KAI4673285.1 Serine/threonine-protein kinase smg1 [Alternaria novae-zelandiae]KAI4946911.1 Serine/threonine-protein kinase smg1 [Alternaria rosae]
MPQAQPELKKVSEQRRRKLPEPNLVKYLEKRVLVQLNGSRKVMGILRGYDVYLNIVLDEALEEKAGGEKVRIGMVVIRGNAVVMLEALDRINQDVPKIGR